MVLGTILAAEFGGLPLKSFTRMHELIPNSKLLIFEDCGHFLALERPNIVNAEIRRFLEDLGYK